MKINWQTYHSSIFKRLTDKGSIKIYCLLCSFLFPLLLSAQPANPQFERLTIEDGLSHGSVRTIFQDSRGYMWFGTSYGLNQYNGYEFQVYRHNPSDSTSIDNNFISSIFEDSKKRLWIGTNESLNYFDRDLSIFKSYRAESTPLNSIRSGGIKDILEDKNGQLWLASPNVLQKFNPETGVFLQYLPKDEKGNYLGLISQIYLDSNNNLWVCTESGLRLFDRQQNRFTNPLPEQKNLTPPDVAFFVTVIEDSDNNLWVAGRGTGLKKYDPITKKWTYYQHIEGDNTSLSSNYINDILADDLGNLWITTGRAGLNYFNKKTQKFTQYSKDRLRENSLFSNSLNSLYADNAGGMWIGTWHRGLNYLKKGNHFIHYKKEASTNSLSANLVTDIVEDAQQNLWVATDDGGGLNYIDRTKNRFKHYQIPQPPGELDFGLQSIKSMTKDRSEQLWIGTMNGLFLFNPNKEEWTHFKHNPKEASSISAGFVNTILQDYKGTIWTGMHRTGLNKMNPLTQSFERYTYQKEGKEISIIIQYLYEDRAGTIWVGTMQNGLLSFNPKTDKFTPLDALKDQNNNSKIGVNVVYEDHKNQLWIGTYDNGLKIYDRSTQQVTTFTEKDGLAGNLVFGILEDDMGRFWISTNKGLSCYDVTKKTFTNFDKDDGLQSNQFMPHSFYKTSKGELCFGGINGLNIVQPAAIINTPLPLPVEITNFQLFNQSVSTETANSPLNKHVSNTKNITLNHKQSVFSFEFAALNFTNPQNNQYAYRLTPYEEEWMQAGTRRFASYSNLPPGDYTFQVKATTNDQLWNDAGTSIQVQILPKPWLTWWAFSLYAFLIGGLFYWVRRYEIARIKMKNELQLERIHHQKEEEVYQAKMKFFTNISHEFRTPLTLIISPIESLLTTGEGSQFAKKQFQLINRNAQQLLKLINQLLDFRKIEIGEMKLGAAKGDIISFTKNVTAVFNSLAEQKQIDWSIHSTIPTLEVWFDWDKLEKILNNLLSNAIKFTPKDGKISISIGPSECAKEMVQIAITDNGPGISKNQIPFIFERFYQVDANTHSQKKGSGIGLAFAKELVELHQGQLLLETIEGKGCTFKVLLPLGKGHLKASEIVEYAASGSLIPPAELTAVPAKKQKAVSKNSPTLLLVDDSAEIRQFLHDCFQSGYQILEAINGKEAWHITQEKMPDLIISDVMMPEMDGIQFCKLLKTNLQTSHIPIILLSALGAIQYRIKGLETGADAYIPKPFNLAFLKAKVNNLLLARKQLKQAFEKDIAMVPKAFSPSKKDEQFLNEIIALIDKNLDNNEFDMEELLKAMKMSHSSMYRKLKSLTNLSGNEFIRNIRLKRAADMLQHDQFNISEVAYKVGFTDPKYFSTCFKKVFGVSPSQYKLKLQQEAQGNNGKMSSDQTENMQGGKAG